MRWIDDDLLADLAALASRGIHDEDAMPFEVPWTRGSPREVAQSVLTYQWSARSRVGPDLLTLELGVLLDGRPVGIQSVAGESWAILHELETGSWLGREHQGNGIGRRMRALMLCVAFDVLGAQSVTSGAFADNAASNAVSRRTGYELDGQVRTVREGAAVTQNRYRMSRSRWEMVREVNLGILGHEVETAGVDALLAELEAS